MRVLVIDDEPDIGKVISLTFTLRWPDSDVAHAANGAQGIAYVRRNSPTSSSSMSASPI